MAIPTHVAFIGLVQIASDGSVFDKGSSAMESFVDRSTSISGRLTFETQHRVLPDEAIPNTDGYPTIKDYIESEAGDDFRLMHLDQYMIITQLIP